MFTRESLKIGLTLRLLNKNKYEIHWAFLLSTTANNSLIVKLSNLKLSKGPGIFGLSSSKLSLTTRGMLGFWITFVFKVFRYFWFSFGLFRLGFFFRCARFTACVYFWCTGFIGFVNHCNREYTFWMWITYSSII